jgi:membrane-anchored glycerophosphoryl diester phosphodiesterase (GDPDase)
MKYKLVNKEMLIDRLMVPVFIAAFLLTFHDTLWGWSLVPIAIAWVYIVRNYRTGRWEL